MGTFLENLLGAKPAAAIQSISQSNNAWPASPKPFYSTTSTTPNYTQQLMSTYKPPQIMSNAQNRYTVKEISDGNVANGGYSGAVSYGGSGTSAGDAAQLANSEGNVAQVEYPAGSFDVTPFKDFYDKAFQQLAPYYKQLLLEAGGDLNVALGNLERDYVTGTRTKVEDFTNAMSTLGATMPAEDTALQGSLNKRGIALTENPMGQTTYAGGGLAGSEVGALDTNQRLRTEAVQRTRQRGLESEAINKLTGGLKSQQEYRNTTQAQQRDHENQANTLAGQYQSAEQLSKAAGIARAEAGVDTGNSGSSGSNVNPEDVWAIKNAHPGYKSWNDENAIKADYRATRGIGK